jgi:hypothetical protein
MGWRGRMTLDAVDHLLNSSIDSTRRQQFVEKHAVKVEGHQVPILTSMQFFASSSDMRDEIRRVDGASTAQ